MMSEPSYHLHTVQDHEGRVIKWVVRRNDQLAARVAEHDRDDRLAGTTTYSIRLNTRRANRQARRRRAQPAHTREQQQHRRRRKLRRARRGNGPGELTGEAVPRRRSRRPIRQGRRQR